MSKFEAESALTQSTLALRSLSIKSVYCDGKQSSVVRGSMTKLYCVVRDEITCKMKRRNELGRERVVLVRFVM